MAVDMKMLNKFYLTLVSPESEPGINMLFDTFDKEPIACFNFEMIQFQKALKNPDIEISSMAARALFAGIVVAALSENPELQEKLFGSWIEQHAREKGLNVVTLAVKQVDKR